MNITLLKKFLICEMKADIQVCEALTSYLLDGGVSLLLGTEDPPTDVRALMGEFLATVTMLLLLAAELLLEEPVLIEEPCGFRTPLTGFV